MSSFRTHYDNLKVSRDAPSEVIKAAYRTLSQKYHPDRNQGADSARIMSILNESYDVLSDPARRIAHDEWIAAQERLAAGNTRTPGAQSQGSTRTQQRPATRPPARPTSAPRRGISARAIGWLVLAVLIAGGLYFEDKTPKPPARPYVRTPPVATADEIWDEIEKGKAAVATNCRKIPYGFTRTENGEKQAVAGAVYSWEKDGLRHYSRNPPDGVECAIAAEKVAPETAAVVKPAPVPVPDVTTGYVSGTIKERMDGRSQVTIDNTGNSSPVSAKLVYLDQAETFPVREFAIAAGESFTVKTVEAGRYDVRYRMLASGDLWKSDEFELKETRMADGIEYSQMTLTLFSVPGGTMTPERIPEDQF